MWSITPTYKQPTVLNRVNFADIFIEILVNT